MLDLWGKLAVVVGGGPVGYRKAAAAREAGAKVKVLAESFAVGSGQFENTKDIEIVCGNYDPKYLEGAKIVFGIGINSEVNARVAADARAIGALVNAADQPDDCDFFLPATISDGDVVAAVGTGGVAPALAGWLRQVMAKALPARVGEFAAVISRARQQLKSSFPNDSKRRMDVMRRLCVEETHQEFIKGGPSAVFGRLTELLSEAGA